MRRPSPGLTLIELIVVICIIGVSAAVLLERLRFYQEAAEKSAVEYTVGAFKSALQLRVAAMLLKGQERNIESLAHVNPVNWLMEPPRGSWYFDATRNELVYVPNLDDHLERLADGSKRLRFRVQISFGSAEADSM